MVGFIKNRAAHAIKKDKKAGAIIWAMTFVTAFIIGSWLAMPLYSTAARIEREEQLAFILKSYKRAIIKYNRIYGSGPHAVEELIKKPPAPRFIRQLYDDPFCTREIKIINSANGLIAVKNQIGEIVNVKSISTEKSASGIEYNRWYADSKLKICLEPVTN